MLNDEAVDNGNEFGAFLTDLSNVFDCIDQSWLLEKLYGFGVSYISLKLIFSYFKSWAKRYGVPQGSIIGLLFFNINLIGEFYECEDSVIEIMLMTVHLTLAFLILIQ